MFKYLTQLMLVGWRGTACLPVPVFAFSQLRCQRCNSNETPRPPPTALGATSNQAQPPRADPFTLAVPSLPLKVTGKSLYCMKYCMWPISWWATTRSSMFTEVHCLILEHGVGERQQGALGKGSGQPCSQSRPPGPPQHHGEENQKEKWRRSGDWKLLQHGPPGHSLPPAPLNTSSLHCCVCGFLTVRGMCSGGTGTLSHAQ